MKMGLSLVKLHILPFMLFVSLAIADDDLGWQVGVGVVTSDVLSDDAERPFFPNVRADNKQYMLIPNLKWQGEQWSVGAEGVGWRYRFDNDLRLQAKAGFPSSRVELSGERGWFRYGTSLSASYANGTTTTAGVNAAGFSYKQTIGFDERREDRKQELSFGAPLYISQKSSMIVIGSAFLNWENAAFIEHENELSTAVDPADYRHAGLNVFSVIPLSEPLTLLLSGTLQWNDKDLTEQLSTLPQLQANTFALLSYQF